MRLHFRRFAFLHSFCPAPSHWRSRRRAKAPDRAGLRRADSAVRADAETPPPPRASRPPMERSLPPGTWWRNPDMVQKLGINSDQQKKIEDMFPTASPETGRPGRHPAKEEITLEPLMSADSPDETKTLAQIDKVAQARAELEKANARFLFAIRRVLTPDQWKKLQELPVPPGGPPPGRGRQGPVNRSAPAGAGS
jgi:Spy/CpxP family protein refolding chaperone